MISNTNTNKSNSTSATDETETTFQVKDCNDQNIGTPVKVKQTAVLNKVTAKICNTEDIYNPINARIDHVSNGLGSKEDAVATTDTGSFSVIAFLKRSLENWASLLSKIPNKVDDKIPVIDEISNQSLEVIKNKLPTPKDGRTPVLPANITTKFREAFEKLDLVNKWNLNQGAGDLVFLDGNTAGASYLVISKSLWNAGNETALEIKDTFNMPIELAYGLHISQRVIGQELAIEIIDTDTPLPDVADLQIANLSQTTTVLTVDTIAPHGLTIGKCVGIRNCANLFANYQNLVVASIQSPTQFTCTVPTATIPNLSNSGFVYFRERFGRANNGVSQIFENASATNSSLYVRSETGDALPSGSPATSHAVTSGPTGSNQLVNSLNSYAFVPSTEYRVNIQADRVQWSDVGVDSIGQSSSRLVRTQVCPNPTSLYKFRIRTNNAKSLTTLTAKVISITKSGSTTGTFITSTPHGLVTGDVINYYGSNSNSGVNFPNLTAATAVVVINETTFTAVIGTGTTGTAFGGVIAKINGNNLLSALGANATTVISASLNTLSDTTRQLILTGSGNWSGISIGDVVEVAGVSNITNGDLLGVDNAWKVANVSSAILTLVPPTGFTIGGLPSNFTTTSCGGAVIKRTDFRISFIRLFDFERQRVEMLARPGNDQSAGAPVTVQNNITVAGLPETPTGTKYIGQFGDPIPTIVADIASAAITTSTTTAAITPAFGSSYEVNIIVTGTSGSSQTMDVSIEESDDNGTNWFKVYDFARITSIGQYRSPKLLLTGNRIRYVQTLGGAAPSFTRSLNRLQCSDIISPIRQLVDRTISINFVNQFTSSLNVQNCDNLQMNLCVAAIGTTAPALQLEGSDDNGLTWTPIGVPQVAVANSTVSLRVTDVNVQFVRARVLTAGVGATAGHVLIKGY